jgi:hypothetical protein
MRIWGRTLELLVALKQMHCGVLREREFDICQEEAIRAGPGCQSFPQTWMASSAEMRDLVMELVDAVRRVDVEGVGLSKEAALRRLSRTPVSGYGQQLSGAKGNLPSRGEVTSLCVEALQLPTGQQGSSLASVLSPRVASIFQDPSRAMLRPEREFLKLVKKVSRYMDPVLKEKSEMMKLCRRLHEAEMLATTSDCIETVDFFAVVKKLEAMNPEMARSRGLKAQTSGSGTEAGGCSGPASGRLASGTATGLLACDKWRRWIHVDYRPASHHGRTVQQPAVAVAAEDSAFVSGSNRRSQHELGGYGRRVGGDRDSGLPELLLPAFRRAMAIALLHNSGRQQERVEPVSLQAWSSPPWRGRRSTRT